MSDTDFYVLASGSSIYHYDDPARSTFTLGSVLRELAQINRFRRATSQPLSVLKHSLVVAALTHIHGGSPDEVLAALLHDAPEAAVGDMATPLKRYLRWKNNFAFDELEDAFADVMTERFGLKISLKTLTPLIHNMDRLAYYIERGLYDVGMDLENADVPNLADPSEVIVEWFNKHTTFNPQQAKEILHGCVRGYAVPNEDTVVWTWDYIQAVVKAGATLSAEINQ